MRPAFPFAFSLPAGSNGLDGELLNHSEQHIGTGMSLREYFAAHAPAEPQAWFEPVMTLEMPTGPPDTPAFPDNFPERPEDRNYIINLAWKWRNNPRYDLTDVSSTSAIQEIRDHENGLLAHVCQELDEYQTAWTAYGAAMIAFEKEYEKQRLIQWPWAWADAVLSSSATGSVNPDHPEALWNPGGAR